MQDDQNRHHDRTDHEPRAVTAPTGFCPVSNGADDRVVERVEDTDNERQQRDRRGLVDEEHAREVDRHHAVPALERHVHGVVVCHDARVGMYAVQTAKPQIIVLDSDAPFISVSKFVSMLRENDVNCVLILLEGSDARHEPCPGIAAIRLDRNDLSPQRVQDAFRHAIAMADSRSAIRLTVSSPHQMPDDLLAYLQSGGPLTPAPRAAVPPDAVGQLLSDGPCFPDAGLRPAAPVLLLLLHGKAALSLLSLQRE